MSSSSHESGPGANQPQTLDGFTTFKYTYDAVASKKDDGGGSFNVINSWYNAVGLGFYSEITSQTPQQFIKLRQFLNNYEEFTILEERIDYRPAFPRADLAASAAAGSSTSTASNYWAAVCTLMMDTTQITYIPDKNDRQLTNTKDTYFQLRGRKDAVSYNLNKPHTLIIYPTANDLRILNYPIGGAAGDDTRPANPWDAYTLQNAVNTGAYCQWGPPEKLGWLPTKVMSISATWGLNTSPAYWGYKEYLYVPIDFTGTEFTDINYGVNTHTITFAFRKPDYRPLVSIPASLMATESQLNDVLNDVTDARTMIIESADQPAFKKVKTDPEEHKEEIRSRVVVPESL